MLKALGLFLILAGGSGVGYSFSNQLSTRYRQLRELQRFVALLRGDVSYGNTPLPEALWQAAGKIETPLREFLYSLSKELKSFPQENMAQLFSRHVEEDLRHCALTKSDKESLCRMGDTLGYLDREMVLRNLQLYETELEQELVGLWESMAGKKKMYQTLGIMGGLFLVILLI